MEYAPSLIEILDSQVIPLTVIVFDVINWPNPTPVWSVKLNASGVVSQGGGVMTMAFVSPIFWPAGITGFTVPCNTPSVIVPVMDAIVRSDEVSPEVTV